MINTVVEYVKELKKDLKDKGFLPVGRLEPQTVIVDFIRWLTKDMDRVENDLYLGKDANDGDDSDNGHWIYDLKEDKWLT